MTTHPPPITVSDRWLPTELGEVTEYTFRPYRGERKVLRKRKPIQPASGRRGTGWYIFISGKSVQFFVRIDRGSKRA